jgi:hypothetical protein
VREGGAPFLVSMADNFRLASQVREDAFKLLMLVVEDYDSLKQFRQAG